jgi:penicillin amidase
MHLPMQLPCIWYENHLVSGDMNLTGVTFPGIPGVVAGHNGYVAWGFTNGFPDVQDLYMERLRRDGHGGVQYEYRGRWLEAEVRKETIGIKGAEPVVEEVVVTRHGPIINALAADLCGEQPLALRWTSLEPDGVVQTLLGISRARTCDEFREALRGWAAPVQNVVYADTAGDIGYSFPGRIPVRAQGDGRVPVPGWTGEYEWLGYIPFDELPHIHNPPQAYVASANNSVTADDYPYFLSSEYAMRDRALRIHDMIAACDKLDTAYMKEMQFNQVSPSALLVAGFLGKLEVDDPELRAVVEMMGSWDGVLAAGSAPAAVYQVFIRRMIQLALQDKLGDLMPRYAGKGPTPILAEGSMFGERSWEWLQETLADPDSHWFDLGGGETRDDLMRLALRETVDQLKGEFGLDMESWAWGGLHTLTYGHTLAQVKPLQMLFNRGPYPLGGDNTTLWATGSSRYDLGAEWVVAPPFRFIADLRDLRNCWGLLAPGQSGHVLSPHYDDQIQSWFDGEYHPMPYERDDVEREAKASLRLVPAIPGANGA